MARVDVLNWPFPITYQEPTNSSTTGRRDPDTGKTVQQQYLPAVSIKGSFHPNPAEDEMESLGGELRPGDAIIVSETVLKVGGLVTVDFTGDSTYTRIYRVVGLLHPQGLIHKRTGRQRMSWHLRRYQGGVGP